MNRPFSAKMRVARVVCAARIARSQKSEAAKRFVALRLGVSPDAVIALVKTMKKGRFSAWTDPEQNLLKLCSALDLVFSGRTCTQVSRSQNIPARTLRRFSLTPTAAPRAPKRRARVAPKRRARAAPRAPARKPQPGADPSARPGADPSARPAAAAPRARFPDMNSWFAALGPAPSGAV